MSKYGIITYHSIPNFGAVLQGYSLCRVLRDMGLDCEIVNYQCENIKKRELTFHKTGNFVKDLIRRNLSWRKNERKIQECTSFTEDMLGKKKYDKDNIKTANQEYDVFISGSDQIWNLSLNGNDHTYFLDFVSEDKFKFSYASSVGGKPEKGDKIQKLLSRYQYLSSRESDTCAFISERWGLECRYVCDPTMLLDHDEWRKLLKPVKERNYILVYFTGGGTLQHAIEYGKKHRKKILVCGVGLSTSEYKYVNICSPEAWLSYIANADCVFTASYHGLLFSIYFHKQVWSFNKSNRSLTLLENLGLKKVYYLNDEKFESKINYDECDKIIRNTRRQSLEYLQKCIEQAEKGVDTSAY